MLKNKNNDNWFENWFNSPYYHILYKNRDNTEAELFIDNLINYLNPKKSGKLLDIACGKGRHAIYLNKKGYSIDGFDLASESIAFAKNFENENLSFYVNDIRKPLKLNYYNYAFNLFTSFGYFVDENDNTKAIKAIAESLKPNAILVLDFMNVNKVINNLVANEVKTVNNITFNISRFIADGFIIKKICFNDKGKDYLFFEKVKAITLANFENYFKSANLKTLATFGNYKLAPFNKNTSDRLILIAKK